MKIHRIEYCTSDIEAGNSYQTVAVFENSKIATLVAEGLNKKSFLHGDFLVRSETLETTTAEIRVSGLVKDILRRFK